MKRITQIAVALLYGLAQSAVATELAHEFTVKSVTASTNPSSLTPDEIASVHAEWLSSTDLKVAFWQMEGCSTTVRNSGSTAALDGNRIFLAYKMDKVAHEPGQPIAMCAWPVHITFTLHGLPRRGYDLVIHVGDYTRSSKVEANYSLKRTARGRLR